MKLLHLSVINEVIGLYLKQQNKSALFYCSCAYEREIETMAPKFWQMEDWGACYVHLRDAYSLLHGKWLLSLSKFCLFSMQTTIVEVHE